MLLDMGMDRKSLKAFAFALGAPAVVGGAKAFIGYKVLMVALGAMLAMAGVDDDPEKWIYDMIRRELGGGAETVARYGLTGAAGVNISSSLAVGMELPRTFTDLLGPFGGAAENMGKAIQFAKQGQAKESSRNWPQPSRPTSPRHTVNSWKAGPPGP